MFGYLILANLVMVGVFVFKYSSLPPQIPLFYSKTWGEDQLGDYWMIFLLPILLDIFFIINQYCYRKFFAGNLFVKRIFDYLNIFLIVGFTLIFVRIVFLVS